MLITESNRFITALLTALAGNMRVLYSAMLGAATRTLYQQASVSPVR
jgi:hypothetical protein